MTLQEQVCTLEQAKKLKELGCKQNTSIFYWYKNKLYLYGKPTQFTPVVNSECTDAYTVAELGEMLIRYTNSLPNWNGDKLWRHDELIMVVEQTRGSYLQFPTEAQARAALLIHILEKEKKHDT